MARQERNAGSRRGVGFEASRASKHAKHLIGRAEDRQKGSRPDLLGNLVDLRHQFEALLQTAKKEEEIQAFLTIHPELLSAYGEVIPKQRLAEDFVTDFVIKRGISQSALFTLVEIERPDRRLFTRRGDVHSDLGHAIRQVLDWERWIEKSKRHLQTKLPDFQTCRYLIILGRDRDLTQQDRERLQAFSRLCSRLRIITYDDLLADSKQLFRSLFKLASQRTKQP